MFVKPNPGELWQNTAEIFCWPENNMKVAKFLREKTFCLYVGFSKTEKTATNKKMHLFLVNEEVLVIPAQYMNNGRFVKCEM